jgi:hypothetical protein
MTLNDNGDWYKAFLEANKKEIIKEQAKREQRLILYYTLKPFRLIWYLIKWIINMTVFACGEDEKPSTPTIKTVSYIKDFNINNINMKNPLQSKTFWLGITTIVGGLAAYFTGEQELQEMVIAVIGGVFTIIRFFTNQSIGFKRGK